MPEYQEITVMNVSGNQAKFIVNNTSVNFTIPQKQRKVLHEQQRKNNPRNNEYRKLRCFLIFLSKM